jgi:hypothetical protein
MIEKKWQEKTVKRDFMRAAVAVKLINPLPGYD